MGCSHVAVSSKPNGMMHVHELARLLGAHLLGWQPLLLPPARHYQAPRVWWRGRQHGLRGHGCPKASCGRGLHVDLPPLPLRQRIHPCTITAT